MPDRENVIKAWETVLSRDPLDVAWDLIDDTITLLKEQEPVAPILVPTGYGAGIVYNCGACGTELVVLNGTNMQGVPSVVRFCRICGKAVKWNA